MTQTTTKRALFASILSLVLCVSMLIGSTFAWFTDSATAGVNSIVAGTLDIDLVDAEGNSLAGQTIGFADMDDNSLWEPGCRYTLEEIKLVNNGNLNAKYKVIINAVIGDVNLAEVIDVYEGETKLGTLDSFLNKPEGIKAGLIAPDETLSFGTLTLVMQESAGNEYQGKSIENIAITVYATQASVEEDSIDSSYDNGALYGDEIVVASQDELDAAIEAATEPTTFVLAAGTYSLKNGSYGDRSMVFRGTEGVTMDLTGLRNEFYSDSVVFSDMDVKFSDEHHRGLTHTNRVVFNNCTLSGTQTLYAPEVVFNNCTFEGNDGKDIYYVWTYGVANATFNDCVFNTNGKAILCYTEGTAVANVTLNRCEFYSDGTVADNKAAVEVGSDNQAQTFTLRFTDCTQEGFAANKSDNALWGNKNSMDADHLIVYIGGERVH